MPAVLYPFPLVRDGATASPDDAAVGVIGTIPLGGAATCVCSPQRNPSHQRSTGWPEGSGYHPAGGPTGSLVPPVMQTPRITDSWPTANASS
jgi:hypothetical protein